MQKISHWNLNTTDVGLINDPDRGISSSFVRYGGSDYADDLEKRKSNELCLYSLWLC